MRLSRTRLTTTFPIDDTSGTTMKCPFGIFSTWNYHTTSIGYCLGSINYAKERYNPCSRTNCFSMTFRQIEQILGDSLPAEAYFYDAFWYEVMPGMTSPMWDKHVRQFPGSQGPGNSYPGHAGDYPAKYHTFAMAVEGLYFISLAEGVSISRITGILPTV